MDMMRRARSWPTALLVALAAFAFGPSVHSVLAQAVDPKVVERPGWSVGDWWEFREKETAVWRLTVVGKENDQYVLARTKQGESASDIVGKTKLYADPDGWNHEDHSGGRTNY